MAFFTSTSSSHGAPAWIQHVFNRDLASLRSSIDAAVTEYESVRRNMVANGRTINARIAEIEATLSAQMDEQDAEFADMRAAEERDVSEIEAKRDEDLLFAREMHRTARRLMQREFDRENDATRHTISGLRSELQFVRQLPCLAVHEPDLRRGMGGGGGSSNNNNNNNNVQDGSNDDDDSSSEVFNEGRCPICTRPFSPPRRNIFACKNGHSFCSECNANPALKNCPMCRLDLANHPPIRNRLAEQLIRRCYGDDGAGVATVRARPAAFNALKREE